MSYLPDMCFICYLWCKFLFVCLFVLILHLAVYHLKNISTIIIFSFSIYKIN